MELRRRVMALASAGAVLGSLATGFAFATVAAAGNSGVTFSSQTAAAGLVSHYVVSHGQRGEDSSGSASSDDRPLQRLYRHGPETVVGLSASTTNPAPQNQHKD